MGASAFKAMPVPACGTIAYLIDFSAGTPAHAVWSQNLKVGFMLLLPFLLKHDVTTQEEFDELYEQFLLEILDERFCGICFFLTVWGKKPT